MALAAGADLHCELCRTAIEGQYAHYEDLGWDLCSTCLDAPRCKGCGLPRIGRLAGGGEYCNRCTADAPRCAACGQAMLDTYWTVAGAEGAFCEHCNTEAPRCSACNCPAFDGRVRDGRFFCLACMRTAVTDPGEYEDVYERIVGRLRERLGIELKRRPVLVIDTRRGLTEAGGGRFPSEDLCGLFQKDALGRTSIRVLSHLSESRVSAVLAHELAHAWQAENCPADQGTRLREGFAEWVAWKALDGLAEAAGERDVIAARTDAYGEGFRLFRGLEERQGMTGALRYARAARRGSAAAAPE